MWASDPDRITWRPYSVSRRDGFGYEVTEFGVREEYDDGATRFIHNETFGTHEEAQIAASKFNLRARKGQTYDNIMKTWA